MDTLSTPISSTSSVKHGGGSTSLLFSSATRDYTISLLKPSSHSLPPTSTLISFYTKPKSLNTKPKSRVSKPKTLLPSSISSSTVHNRAATGYAAALADATSRAGTLSETDSDAHRIIKLVSPVIDETDKAAKVVKVIQESKFEKHVVAIIKLLLKKGKIGLIEEVMIEFVRIYNELTGTKNTGCGPF